MFTFKNISAIAFFLFGTTFVWMTSSFIGESPTPTGILWSVVNTLALAAVVAFTVTAWGVYKQTPWWETAAIVSAVVGLVAVVPYVIAINGQGELGDQGVVVNIGLHVICSLIVVAVAVVPVVHDWFTTRWDVAALMH
jgi:hypothetical protein